MAHAENYGTEASGKNSHAEGLISIAKGNGSHAEGFGTVASGKYQHVQGKYNVEDTEGRYAHIVGGGSDAERRDIHTLDWEGNAKYAGDVIATIDGKEVSMSTIAGVLLQPGAATQSTVGNIWVIQSLPNRRQPLQTVASKTCSSVTTGRWAA